ncbi:unnamed protein product, partial [Prorocentrum cordatum]
RPRGPSPARGVAFRAARAPRHETPRARGRRTVTPWPGARGESQTPRSPVRGTTERCTRRTDARTRPARPTVSQTRPAATVRGKRIDNLRYPTQALNAGYTGSLSTRGNQTGTKVGAGPGDPPTTRTWPRPGPPVALVRQPGGSLLQDIPRNDSAVHCSVCAVHRQRVKRHGSPRRRGARTRRKASIVASGHPQVGTSPLTKRDVPASRVAVPCPHRPRGELARPRLPAGQARRPTGSLTSRRGGDSLGASVAQVACTPSLDASSQAEAGAAGPPARRPRGPQRWAARERQREAAAATLPMGRREEEETGGEEKGERRREGRENNDRHKAL